MTSFKAGYIYNDGYCAMTYAKLVGYSVALEIIVVNSACHSLYPWV